MGCHMGGMCSKLTALLILVAGLVLLLFGLGKIDVMLAHQVAGGAFTLVGLAKLVHCMGMCSMCNKECKNC